MFEEARPFLLALAIGLLIGIERERAKADAPYHAPLGSRTFALLALLGATAATIENAAVAIVLTAFAGAAILAGFFRSKLEAEEAEQEECAALAEGEGRGPGESAGRRPPLPQPCGQHGGRSPAGAEEVCSEEGEEGGALMRARRSARVNRGRG